MYALILGLPGWAASWNQPGMFFISISIGRMEVDFLIVKTRMVSIIGCEFNNKTCQTSLKKIHNYGTATVAFLSIII